MVRKEPPIVGECGRGSKEGASYIDIFMEYERTEKKEE